MEMNGTSLGTWPVSHGARDTILRKRDSCSLTGAPTETSSISRLRHFEKMMPIKLSTLYPGVQDEYGSIVMDARLGRQV